MGLDFMMSCPYLSLSTLNFPLTFLNCRMAKMGSQPSSKRVARGPRGGEQLACPSQDLPHSACKYNDISNSFDVLRDACFLAYIDFFR